MFMQPIRRTSPIMLDSDKWRCQTLLIGPSPLQEADQMIQFTPIVERLSAAPHPIILFIPTDTREESQHPRLTVDKLGRLYNLSSALFVGNWQQLVRALKLGVIVKEGTVRKSYCSDRLQPSSFNIQR